MPTPASPSPPKMLCFETLPEWGAATTALTAEVEGRKISVFPKREKVSGASYRFFNAPLFPLANRLRLDATEHASVCGISVKMPLNHVASVAGAIPHHLHGLVYDQKPKHRSTKAAESHLGEQQSIIEYEIFFGEYWTSQAQLVITQTIKNGAYIYEATAKNSGSSPLPVGFGSHPYFQIPSGHAKALQLKIPAAQVTEVDNLDNVLPLGTFKTVKSENGRLDFNSLRRLPDGVVDHYFQFDLKAKKEILFVDTEAKIQYKMTALTDNIMGAQVYYPGNGSIVAIEMVTNLPDPREELWKNIPTGMQLLPPGESAKYSYRIEIETL